jgi:hypothetical protein
VVKADQVERAVKVVHDKFRLSEDAVYAEQVTG